MTKKIMLIEDDNLLRELMEMYLKNMEEDWEILSFGDAKSVQNYLNEYNGLIDLLIVDIKLPDKNGVELVEEIKERRENIPAIFITGYVNEPIIEKIENEDNLLLKPFPPEKLIELSKKLMNT